MGYSLSVSCNHPRNQEKMLDFLSDNYLSMYQLMMCAPERRRWEQMGRFTVEESLGGWRDRTKQVLIGEQIGYGGAPSKLGFNFSSSSGASGVWMWAFLGWVALKVGRKRSLNCLSPAGLSGEAVPYVTYDSEPTPIICPDRTQELLKIATASNEPVIDFLYHRGYLVNNLGMNLHLWETAQKHSSRLWVVSEVPEWLTKSKAREALVRDIVYRELQRLDNLWENS